MTSLLWMIAPYVAFTSFVLGHLWRYRTDQFGWTTRSTQLLESRVLRWASTLFHFGALAAIAGHVLGILDKYGVQYADRSTSMWDAAGIAVQKIQGGAA